MALGGQHVEELTPAGPQGLEVLKDRIRRRTGAGVHRSPLVDKILTDSLQ
jgi:hypothetical protein